jgi:hypothetical protein
MSFLQPIRLPSVQFRRELAASPLVGSHTRIMDSNVHDLIAADYAVLQAIQNQIEDGSTLSGRSYVATTGAVWDVSRWDECS